jgi:TonB family protein
LRKEKKMDKFLLYLLKVAAVSGVFYTVYLLLFSKDTFYLRNRILLILLLVLSIILPEIKIPVYTSAATATAQINNFDNPALALTASANTLARPAGSFDYNRIFLLIYFSVAIYFIIRAVISVISTYSIIRKGTLIGKQFPKIVLNYAEISPFSFYPYAVIPVRFYNTGKYSDILDHEFAHIRQGHTFDLLLAELFIAFQWFNPFAWLIKRSVILNHEYLADKISLLNNTSIKEYQYRLLNFQTELRSISLAHNFNSLTKNRIIMINKKPTRRNATLKNLLILPAVAFGIYAFASPVYRNATPPETSSAIYTTSAIQQNEIKGVVLDENGKPLEGVLVTCTGTPGHAFLKKTESDGRFIIMNAEKDASIDCYLEGYKEQSMKPDFKTEMKIIMLKDPDYKKKPVTEIEGDGSKQLVVVDREITTGSLEKVASKMQGDIAFMRTVPEKEAIEKYGNKGRNGVVEIYTRKRAKEFGIKVPFRRTDPKDFPTFQGKTYPAFSDWVISQIKYPAEAAARGSQGHITANYTVDTDGSINTVHVMGTSDQSLIDAVTKAIKSSPKWEAPKNPEVNEAFDDVVSIKFELPDKVEPDDVFIMVDQMPMYPGGDEQLLKFITDNTHYPEAAIPSKKQGRVIVRFIVDTDGKAVEPTILKGIDPLLDAEALRVVSAFKGFIPGSRGGVAVKVYYMVPVNFALPSTEPVLSKTSEFEILKFIGSNTGYPQEAKSASDTGSVYVVVKMSKGGILNGCKAYTKKSEVSVPFISEVVIVGYKPSSGQTSTSSNIVASADHPSLKTESVRVAAKLNEIAIPEWKEKDIEFAIPIKFILK